MSHIENTRVWGLNENIVASGYPMATEPFNKEYFYFDQVCTGDYSDFKKKILKRCDKLAAAPIGSGHDQFLTSIIVQFDLTFPLKAWVELQRYHFIDFCSSMSTMHKITNMDVEKCCNDYVDNDIINILEKYIEHYINNPTNENFYRMIYNIPSGFEYTARLTTNYRQLKTIYSQRRNHRLPDWHVFCDWIETLPYSEWITGDKNGAETRN